MVIFAACIFTRAVRTMLNLPELVPCQMENFLRERAGMLVVSPFMGLGFRGPVQKTMVPDSSGWVCLQPKSHAHGFAECTSVSFEHKWCLTPVQPFVVPS